jgi:fructose-1,6-bisphosphatase/inositol monophosphatase family enzyme
VSGGSGVAVRSKPFSPEEFVRRLAPAMEQAASIAAALEGRVPNIPKASEEGPAKAALTIADTAAQETLLVPLLGGFRRARLEAEEDTPSAGHFTGRAEGVRIVIDPIDGTLHFYLERLGPYAVMAGLALDDRYAAALVALPREGLLLHAVRRQGARIARLGRSARPARPSRGARRVLISHGLPDAVAAVLREAGYEVAPACGGAIAVAPLLPGVAGGLRLARGGSISTRGRIGVLIAREAGARVETADGAPFPDGIDEPATALLVASDPETAAVLRQALSAA